MQSGLVLPQKVCRTQSGNFDNILQFSMFSGKACKFPWLVAPRQVRPVHRRLTVCNCGTDHRKQPNKRCRHRTIRKRRMSQPSLSCGHFTKYFWPANKRGVNKPVNWVFTDFRMPEFVWVCLFKHAQHWSMAWIWQRNQEETEFSLSLQNERDEIAVIMIWFIIFLYFNVLRTQKT